MRILKRLSQIALVLLISTIIITGSLFGPRVQENMHLAYLRFAMRDVVKITNSKGSGGTGWLTKTPKGKRVIITNGHVCGLAENGFVYVHYRGDVLLLRVLKVDPKHDLCAIVAPQGNNSGFKIASDVDEGESIFTLGHPYLEPNSITKGELSGLVVTQILAGINLTKEQCTGETYTLEETDPNSMANIFGIKTVCIRSLESYSSTIVILPGNSGSPDVNIYGSVVSVTYAANESGTRSYHVPLSFLKGFLGSL